MPNETNNSEEVRYEALAMLISQTQEDEKGRWKDFKESFSEFKANLKCDLDELKQYNKTQNGRQADMMGKIADLEAESQKRKLTCMKAVGILQKKGVKDEERTEEREKERTQERKEAKDQRLSRNQWVAVYVVTILVATTSVGGFVISLIKFFAG